MATAYSVSIFKSLIEEYPTFADLRLFLESPSGGILRVIDCGNERVIFRTDNSSTVSNALTQRMPSPFGGGHLMSPDSVLPSSTHGRLPTVSNATKWFRSVVWNTRLNRPECVAPPSSEDEETIEADSGSITVCQEFLEGVMINAFMDTSGTVHIASRSRLDATGTFYSKRSFNDLLLDALKERGLTDIQELQTLMKGPSSFMSMLLQHPEHRIVTHVTKPAFHIIHTGVVLPDGTVTISEESGLPSIDSSGQVFTLANLQKWVGQLAEQKGWQWQGIVLKDGAGKRWRIRSSAYTMVRALRGDMSRPDVRFLKLREKQLVDTYLFYYPEESSALWNLEQSVRNLTFRLYNVYVNTHITRQVKFVNIPAHLKTHIYTLHSMYLSMLQPQGFFILKQEVVKYINALPSTRILHLLKSEKLEQAN